MPRFSTIVLVDTRGWLLLQERDEHPVLDPEKWALVGGHVEEGEEFEPAAHRELAEETGIEMPPGGLTLWREVAYAGSMFQVWYAAVDLTDDDIVLGEGRQIVFVDPDRVGELDLAGFARLALADFLTSDEYRGLTGSTG